VEDLEINGSSDVIYPCPKERTNLSMKICTSESRPSNLAAIQRENKTPGNSSVWFNLALSPKSSCKGYSQGHVTFIKTLVSKQPSSDPFDRYSKHFQSLPLDSSSSSIAAEMLFHHWTQ